MLPVKPEGLDGALVVTMGQLSQEPPKELGYRIAERLLVGGSRSKADVLAVADMVREMAK